MVAVGPVKWAIRAFGLWFIASNPASLHGAQDELIPPQQVERLRKAMAQRPNVTFDIPADGNHCCHNIYAVVRPRMADWLAERLGGRT